MSTTPPTNNLPAPGAAWVTLPDNQQLYDMGVHDGQARAHNTTQSADDVPPRAYWLLDIGAVLAEGLYPAYGYAQRTTVPNVGRTTATAALATTTRVEHTAEAKARQGDLDELETNEPPASLRFGFLARLPWWPYVLFLAGLGAAETLFNVGAFQITGEDAWRVAVMAGMVGLSGAMSGHLIGSSLQELSLAAGDDRVARTSHRHAVVRAVVGACLAVFMLIGFFAVANLRATYFTYNANQQQADTQVIVSGLPSTVPVTPSANAGASDESGADSVPEVSWMAPFALNLMVWAVAIAAGYHHSSVHRHVRRDMRRDRAAVGKKHDSSRAKEIRAISEEIASLSSAIEAIGNALSDALKQTHLTNAAVKLYLASYMAELDRVGINHFDIAKAPKMELPKWAAAAQLELDTFCKARAEHLRHLDNDYATDAAAASARLTSTAELTVADEIQPADVADIGRDSIDQAA